MQDLSDIAVFVRVVETGGFTAAAGGLGLSQSAVSRRVSALEKRLGVQLLQRTTRRLRLTEAGAEYFQRARRSLRELEEAELEVTRHQAEPQGTLRVTAPAGFTLLHLTPLIGPFVARYPAVRLELSLEDRRVDIIEEGFDLALRVAELEDSGLVARKIAAARRVICASPAYLERRGVPKHPEELVHHDCMVYTYGPHPGRWRFGTRGSGRDIIVPVRGPVTSNNGTIQKEAALADLGLVDLPTFYVGDELRSGRLRAVLGRYTPLTHGIFALYPKRRGLAPKVRAFVDFLQGRFGDPPYWDRDLRFPQGAGRSNSLQP